MFSTGRSQSCDQLSASRTSLFLIGYVLCTKYLLRHEKLVGTSFPVFLATFPEIITSVLFS